MNDSQCFSHLTVPLTQSDFKATVEGRRVEKGKEGKKKGGLRFTKLDNKIRALYLEKDTFLPINQNLFSLPVARILAKTAKTKESHLLKFQAAKQRLEAFNHSETLKNVVNPANRCKRKKKAKKANTTTTTATTFNIGSSKARSGQTLGG
jgi:hypothetical protein